MVMKIGRHFCFEAAHKLPDCEIYGECSNLHGHRYELEIEVEGTVTKEGWICNFKELKAIVNEHVIEKYDHSYLNDFFEIPTIENVATEIIGTLNKVFESRNYTLKKLKIYETANCYVEVDF